MKRLVIFCDGTWNRLSAKYPTNVVLAAQSVAPVDKSGVLQIVYYDEGVGTTFLFHRFESILAGALGLGLFDKIADAYRFLVFNYDPGDEIFIFGFSRGAYTARSLCGLIRKCGIITRDRANMVEAAFSFYRNRSRVTHPDMPSAQRFRLENSQDLLMKPADSTWRLAEGMPEEHVPDALFTIKYLGVWDTVGALGIPKHLWIESILRTAKKYQFHDPRLSSIVEAARHAVAVDEDRISFTPALWKNLPKLNAIPGRSGDYLQRWFPGDHGSVGGGGEIVGLSSYALLWILEGARNKGLQLDPARLEAFAKAGNPLVPLHNSKSKPGLLNRIYRRGPRRGPRRPEELSESTLQRLAFQGSPECWTPYRPKPLERVAKLLKLPVPSPKNSPK